MLHPTSGTPSLSLYDPPPVSPPSVLLSKPIYFPLNLFSPCSCHTDFDPRLSLTPLQLHVYALSFIVTAAYTAVSGDATDAAIRQ